MLKQEEERRDVSAADVSKIGTQNLALNVSKKALTKSRELHNLVINIQEAFLLRCQCIFY